MKINKTRMICEAAIFIAMAEILSLIKLYEFPNGGSITLEMLPIILFAARYGCGWGSLAGLVYGTITYLIGNKFSVDWTTIICDYFIAFVALGFGAGLLSRRKWSVYYGTVIGGVLRFLAHFLIGVFVWGKWMPDTFLGKPMTSPWIYSLIYNGSYMLPSIVLCLVVFASTVSIPFSLSVAMNLSLSYVPCSTERTVRFVMSASFLSLISVFERANFLCTAS